jgi:catechol 2,3-dioxygenase-like lactoylglutathione lyase family enzyme
VVPPAHGWVSPAFAIPNGITLGERERESTREDARRSPDRAGVAIGLGVDDLDAVYDYCTAAGCTITSEPRVEPFGDRVFECIDPCGYLWEISQPVAEVSRRGRYGRRARGVVRSGHLTGVW